MLIRRFFYPFFYGEFYSPPFVAPGKRPLIVPKVKDHNRLFTMKCNLKASLIKHMSAQ
jgi:hypothetical protein